MIKIKELIKKYYWHQWREPIRLFIPGTRFGLVLWKWCSDYIIHTIFYFGYNNYAIEFWNMADHGSGFGFRLPGLWFFVCVNGYFATGNYYKIGINGKYFWKYK